jgi:hypothetical protein
VDLDSAIDELYAADLGDFVSERKRLSKELDPEEAAEFAKLRKPTVAAWALNQLARRNRRDVDLLLDAGHRLREAQTGVLRGKEREGFEQAQTIERDALRRLTKAAQELLGNRSATVLNQVEQTLRSAAVSESGREVLARGRFVEPLGAEGFDVVTALAASVPASGKAKRRAQPGRDEREAAAEALKEAKARLREAEKAARDAERRAEAAHAEADRADEAAESARGDVTRAEREVAGAEQTVARLRRR